MLYRERDVSCKEKTDVGCAEDLQMKITLDGDTPVEQFYPELKAYIEDFKIKCS